MLTNKKEYQLNTIYKTWTFAMERTHRKLIINVNHVIQMWRENVNHVIQTWRDRAESSS